MIPAFISYDGSDIEYIKKLWPSLIAININPYLSEYIPKAGIDIAEKIKSQISMCNYFIPILSINAMQSQWVNQEIGYAVALNKVIIPIVEDREQMKGFLKNKEDIKFHKNFDSYYDQESFDDTVYLLIKRLRELTEIPPILPMLEIPRTYSIKCSQCSKDGTTNLPSQIEIDNAISENNVFVSECPHCKNSIQINPKTLQPI